MNVEIDEERRAVDDRGSCVPWNNECGGRKNGLKGARCDRMRVGS